MTWHCPVWQCGGIMLAVERSPPKGWNENANYDGDWQCPDLVCQNCGAIYHFVGFKEA